LPNLLDIVNIIIFGSSLLVAIKWDFIVRPLDSMLNRVNPSKRWHHIAIGSILPVCVVIYLLISWGNFYLQHSTWPFGNTLMLIDFYLPPSFMFVGLFALFSPARKLLVCVLSSVTGWILWISLPIMHWGANPRYVWAIIIPTFTMSFSAYMVYRALVKSDPNIRLLGPN
jgi:hypothetical protein